MKFSQNLRALRQGKEISQRELGDLFSVSKQSVSNWENGVNTPDIETLKKLATFFNVSLAELLGENGGEEITIQKALGDENFLKFVQLKLALIKMAGIKNGATNDDPVVSLIDNFASLSRDQQEAFLSAIYKGVIKTDTGFEMTENPIFSTPGMDDVRKEISNLSGNDKLLKVKKLIKNKIMDK